MGIFLKNRYIFVRFSKCFIGFSLCLSQILRYYDNDYSLSFDELVCDLYISVSFSARRASAGSRRAVSIGTPLRLHWMASTSLSPVPITAAVTETVSQASAFAIWDTRVTLIHLCLHSDAFLLSSGVQVGVTNVVLELVHV